MTERRSADRRRVIKGCRVLFNSRSSSVDCVVRNQTEEGARLRAESSHFLPDTFELVLTQARKLYPCHVVWRRGSEVGVAFTGPAQEPPRYA